MKTSPSVELYRGSWAAVRDVSCRVDGEEESQAHKLCFACTASGHGRAATRIRGNRSELALDLGFASHGHFSAAFAAVFGAPPSAFQSRANGSALVQVRKIPTA